MQNQYSFFDPTIAARLTSLPLVSRTAMVGGVSGRHTSPHRGSSVEFAEYRKYVPGDDLRRLDWRAYGRTDRFYVKEFEADTNLRCILVLDSSGSMNFGSVGSSKWEYALRLASTLAYLAIQQGDAAGLICASNTITHRLPPRRNPAHLSAWMELASQVKPSGETHLPRLLHELAETVSQRAMVIVFSDFFDEPSRWRDCFEHLRFRKHDVSAFHLLDPEELQFEFQRPTRFTDMEGTGSMFVEPSEIQDRYQTALQDFLASLQQTCLETRTEYQRVSIDKSVESTLKEFLVARLAGTGRQGSRM
jgi:uncharacterized protein (DUF58 family)